MSISLISKNSRHEEEERSFLEAGVDLPADVVIERTLDIKVVRTAVASNVNQAVKVAEVAGSIAPGADGGALAVDTGLGAESSILSESPATVVAVELESIVGVTDEASGGVCRLEGVAVAGGETGADDPGGGLGGVDLGADHLAAVVDVAVGAAGGGGLERDGVTNVEGRVGVQAGGGVASSRNVLLDLVLSIIAGVSLGHGTFVEGTLRTVRVITADTKEDSTLLRHGVVTSLGGTSTIVELGQSILGGVTTTEGPVARLTLEDTSNEARVHGRVVVLVLGLTRVEIVLKIGHDPRTRANTGTAPAITSSKVEGLHVA